MKITDGIVAGAAIGLGIATTTVILLVTTIGIGAAMKANEEKINEIAGINKNESEVK